MYIIFPDVPRVAINVDPCRHLCGPVSCFCTGDRGVLMSVPDDSWADPAPIPSPNLSPISLSQTPSNFNPYPPTNFPSISPILPHSDLTKYHVNDTYLHTPNNHPISNLPNNITIMNDTYILSDPTYYE